MRWFKKRNEALPKLETHDFTQLIQRAREDNDHYQKIQATFADLKKPYQSSKQEMINKR